MLRKDDDGVRWEEWSGARTGGTMGCVVVSMRRAIEESWPGGEGGAVGDGGRECLSGIGMAAMAWGSVEASATCRRPSIGTFAVPASFASLVRLDPRRVWARRGAAAPSLTF